jgi:hypothetical protein
LANTINGFGDGWSASVLARGGLAATALGGENGHLNPINANALNTSLNIVSALGIHGDWWQGYSGDRIRENVIIRNNICRADNSADNNAFLFNDAANAYDHILKCNIWASGPDAGCPNNSFGGRNSSHYVFENNTMQGQFIRREYINGNPAAGPDVGDRTYSSFKNNVMGDVVPFGYSGAGAFYPNSPSWQNCLYDNARNYPMSGGGNTGNLSYPNRGFQSLFVDYERGDFRPKEGTLLLSTLKPRVNRLDGRLLPFEADDVIGAWSKSSTAPAYPF